MCALRRCNALRKINAKYSAGSNAFISRATGFGALPEAKNTCFNFMYVRRECKEE
jgi:hypothetical protein